MPGMRLNYQLWTSKTGTNSGKAYCSAIYSFIIQIITNAFLFFIWLRQFMVSNLLSKYLACMDSVKCMLTHLIPTKHTCHYSCQLAKHVAVLWRDTWQPHRDVNHFSFL